MSVVQWRALNIFGPIPSKTHHALINFAAS